MLFLDFPNQGAAREYWDFCGLGMSAGSRGAILSMKKLMIAAQWVAKNLQGGCGWEFPCVWSRQNIAKLIANRILNKLQSFQKKRHTLKSLVKLRAWGFFTSVGLEDLLFQRGWGDRTLLSMAPFLTPNQKTSSIFQNLQELGLLPLRKPDWSTCRQYKLCSPCTPPKYPWF